MDGSAARTRAVGNGAAAGQDLDALDRLQRNGRQARCADVVLVDPHAVQQHQRVLVCRNAEAAQVELLVRRPGVVAHVNAAQLGQQFGQRSRPARIDVGRINDARADRSVAQALGKARRRDDDGVVVLAPGRGRKKTHQHRDGGEMHCETAHTRPLSASTPTPSKVAQKRRSRKTPFPWLQGRSPDSRVANLNSPDARLPVHCANAEASLRGAAAAAQWPGVHPLAYRCGGSPGLAPPGFRFWGRSRT